MAVPMERKPAAILAAFVMGDSPVVGTGPVPNAACLKTLRLECVEPLIGEYHGQVVRRMSAGVLAEFANAVDAVQCAVAIQKGMAAREVEVGEAGRIRYRVGVNLCRINVKRDDIFGDEFDDAARLATLAEPGGICIARTVYDEVKSELKLQYEQHSDWMNIALMSTHTPDSWPSTMDLIEVSAVKINPGAITDGKTDPMFGRLLRHLRRLLDERFR